MIMLCYSHGYFNSYISSSISDLIHYLWRIKLYITVYIYLLQIWQKIRVRQLDNDLGALRREVDSLRKRLGINYLDEFDEFQNVVSSSLRKNDTFLFIFQALRHFREKSPTYYIHIYIYISSIWDTCIYSCIIYEKFAFDKCLRCDRCRSEWELLVPRAIKYFAIH